MKKDIALISIFWLFSVKTCRYIYTIKQGSGIFTNCVMTGRDTILYTANTVDSLTRNNYKQSIWRDMGFFNKLSYWKYHTLHNQFIIIIEVSHQMWGTLTLTFLQVLIFISILWVPFSFPVYFGVQNSNSTTTMFYSCLFQKLKDLYQYKGKVFNLIIIFTF